MKKNILFLVGSLDTGGVSKSLLNLLSEFDYDSYNVDLLILSSNNYHINSLNKNVNLVESSMYNKLVDNPKSSLKQLIISFNPLLFFLKLSQLFVSKFSRAYSALILSKLLPRLDKEYDCAIDFNGQHQLYYLVDSVRSRKKISFFHSDYGEWDKYFSVDKSYYTKVDHIFTISDKCVASMKNYFPECEEKIGLMKNIISSKVINKLSNETCNTVNKYMSDKTISTLVTVGHVTKMKGSELAIYAARLLKEQGLNFKWIFVGSISEPSYYNDLVSKNDLSDSVVFTGPVSNPLAIMANADVIVHPSRFEGKSIALDEAKVLCRPIVVTNFSTVSDQFKDKENGIICEMNPQSLSTAILSLVKNNDMKKILINNLHTENIDNVTEVETLYKVIRD